MTAEGNGAPSRDSFRVILRKGSHQLNFLGGKRLHSRNCLQCLSSNEGILIT